MVIGVLPPGVGLPADAEFWQPYPHHISVEVIARTRGAVSVSDVQRELHLLAPGVELAREFGDAMRVVVMPLHERLYGANAPILRLLLGTVGLLLILACTNVANLSLARTLQRRGEIAMCIALGASSRLLAWQVLAENIMLAIAGGAVGLLAAVWTTGLLVRLSPAQLPGVRGAGMSATGFLFGTAVAMLAAIAVSLAPAVAVTRGDLRPMLGQSGPVKGTAASSRTRRALVVAQLAIALLLLKASALLIRSMVRLSRIDIGFNPRGLLIAQLPLYGERYASAVRRRALLDEIVEQARAVPGVRSVALGPPPLVGGRGPTFVDGYSEIFAVRDSTTPGAPRSNVWVKHIDPQYLSTFQISVREGRGIIARVSLRG
jgi:putative ABC transport system permease protein